MVLVRDIQRAEIARLSAITLAAYTGLEGIDVGPYRATLADVADRVRHAEVLVAVTGDQVLGGVTYVPDAANRYAEFRDRDTAGMRMLAVAPAAQGAGVGAALVEACIGRARTRRRRRLVLHTTAAMTAAQRLYEQFGFQRVAQRDWWPQPHIKLLGYELTLERHGVHGVDPSEPGDAASAPRRT